MLAKMLMPETGQPATAGGVNIEVEKPGVNIIDAAARGAGDGLHLALNVGAMLIAFLALIAMVNGILGGIHGLHGFGWIPSTLQGIWGRCSLRSHGYWESVGTIAGRLGICWARG